MKHLKLGLKAIPFFLLFFNNFQNVKCDVQEKLDTLSSRVDNLENLSSRSNNSVELQNVTTEQSIDAGKRH